MQAKLFEPYGQTPDYGDTKDDWYTPSSIIEPARRILWSIDLDPASCALANEVVKAKKYFTIDDDGLSQDWFGNVWCNPPYSDTDRWVKKALKEFREEKINHCLFLCNASVDSRYVHRLLYFPNCFLLGRVAFWHPGKETGRARLGSMLTLISGDPARILLFKREFSKLGAVKL